ncbi:hypothetical protein ACWEO4_43235 [Streptomyces sp. NPDC004393]|uniref:hypothetical protein n=1 Tax=Streptomyces sp. NPDC004533 TaxID=3154278 RepID=UPI0033AB045D
MPDGAGLRTKCRTDAPAGGRAAGFVPGALVPRPLRGQLDDPRHRLILVGQPDEEVRELRRWCAERLGVVLGLRTVARRGRPALALARPDGHVDGISKDAPEMRARLTDLFRPLLGARQEEQENAKTHTA